MKTERIEKIEIINAGYDAVYALEEALDYLNKASNWGIVDILGGGMMTSLLKRGKINKANEAIEKAKRALRKFNDELDDVHLDDEFSIDTDSFLAVSDWLMDNSIFDFMMQSKISESKKNVKSAIEKIRKIIKVLEKQV